MARLTGAEADIPEAGSDSLKSLLPLEARAVFRVGADLARGGWRWISGQPLVFPEFGSQTIEDDDISIVDTMLSRPESWTDSAIEESLHSEFSRWNGSASAFAFMGGRVALSACIEALNLSRGDEVVAPGYTCIVVPNAFAHAGLEVRYCDIELDSYGPDFDSLRAAVTPKTRAILVQHLYGLVCRDFEQILDFARNRNLRVIEDCAHTLGATFKGRKVGNWGDVGFYSTEQSKVMSTFNGGIAVANAPEIINRLGAFHQRAPYPDSERTRRMLRSMRYYFLLQKSPTRWFMKGLWDYGYRRDILASTSDEELRGILPRHYGERMPAALARVALNQLSKVDRFNSTRRRNAERWQQRCLDAGLATPTVIENSTPVFLRYPVIVPVGRKYDADWCLDQFGVLPGHWFTGEFHPIRKVMPQCPHATIAVERCLNLPTLP
jgi:dTDP-4-amino-4,6-dideoxygalactose transaminase